MSPRSAIENLRGSLPVVAPSMLMCDFGNLEREIRALEDAGAQVLHLDVMDGHFVPNASYGLTLVETFRRLTTLPLDAHLMIANPAEYAPRYVEAGADLVTIHYESTDEPDQVLAEIASMGAATGLAINPPTPWEVVTPVIELCDLVLVMSVMPGFGGQRFQASALEKLSHLAGLRTTHGCESLLLEIDGGVAADTIGGCASAGADVFVVGSAIFGNPPYSDRLSELAELARHGRKSLIEKR
ncbi:MAG: ribulose-phosphate 3-epimerase [Pirellulales bacterium]|nr:ribulose-phosphate 3-epimerase [Planctomycetales bacterium]